MPKQKGTVYACKECGTEVKVEKECECEPCDLVCCGEEMKAKKAAGGKAKGCGCD